MKYAIVIESHVSPTGEQTWGAFAPDLPGCGVVGRTPDEARQLIREAIEFHLEGLRQGGFPFPPALSEVDFVEANVS